MHLTVWCFYELVACILVTWRLLHENTYWSSADIIISCFTCIIETEMVERHEIITISGGETLHPLYPVESAISVSLLGNKMALPILTSQPLSNIKVHINIYIIAACFESIEWHYVR